MIEDTLIEDGVLRVILKGPYEPDRAPGYFRGVVDELRKAGLHKVLLDGRGFKDKLSIMDRFAIGTMFSSLGPLNIKIAIVGNKRLVLPDRFVENVATNRGVALKVTTDIEEALSWLRAGPKETAAPKKTV
ncbi:hypothetical protein JXO52_06565 [bacterium]|nr:hypothetical protein [bacterium]